MKTRIIHTKFWEDSFIIELEPGAKLLFLYFLTNPRNNLIGCYELPLRIIELETGLSREEITEHLNTIKDKIIYFDNYVIIINSRKYQNYESGSKNQRAAYAREYENLPDSIKDLYNNNFQLVGNQSSSSCGLDINQNIEIINNNNKNNNKYINNNNNIIKRVRAKNRSTVQDSDFCELLADDERMNNLLTRIKEKYPRYTLEWLRDKVEQLREWHAGAPPSKRKKDLERFIFVTAGRDYKQFLDTLAAEKRLQNAEGGYKSSVQRNMEDNARIDAWRIVRALKIDLEEGNISLQEYQEEIQKLENKHQ